jgi:apolipoprotein N-acyltransferase
MLTRIAHVVLLSFGWRRSAIALTAGAVSALAMAPFHAWPLLFVTFPVLVWLIDGSAAGRWGRVMSAAAAGWWFGFGYFLAGLYWIGIAFLVDAPTFGWLMPFAVLGMPAGLALFTAFGTGLAAALWVSGATRILTLAACLTIAEYLRGTILSGFPWNAFGYALAAPLALAQSASLVGLWGLTFIAVAVFASPAALADAEAKRRWMPLAASLGILAAMAIFGIVRLQQNPTQFVEGPRLRLMQPNLPQDVKFNYGAKADVMRRYLDISRGPGAADARGMNGITHLIWPESAFPFLLTREPDALAQIAELLPPGSLLVTGAARLSEAGGDNQRAYNSIYAIGDEGSILSTYDKVHLVPFGEYLPLQNFLENLGFQQLTKVRGGFTAGHRRRLMTIPGMPPAVPLICYEIIFPGAIMPVDEPRPGWMLNVTNDGWFGNSSGPYQHFHQSRVRAIEEGLPLVRVANTGISAIVDPLGRITAQLPLGSSGNLDGMLPKPVTTPIFARTGNAPSLVFLLLVFVFCVRLRFGGQGRRS